jgi:hypothetical protein
MVTGVTFGELYCGGARLPISKMSYGLEGSKYFLWASMAY